jgi:hypothetical protein
MIVGTGCAATAEPVKIDLTVMQLNRRDHRSYRSFWPAL